MASLRAGAVARRVASSSAGRLEFCPPGRVFTPSPSSQWQVESPVWTRLLPPEPVTPRPPRPRRVPDPVLSWEKARRRQSRLASDSPPLDRALSAQTGFGKRSGIPGGQQEGRRTQACGWEGQPTGLARGGEHEGQRLPRAGSETARAGLRGTHTVCMSQPQRSARGLGAWRSASSSSRAAGDRASPGSSTARRRNRSRARLAPYTGGHRMALGHAR